jgi:hypothetical protein
MKQNKRNDFAKISKSLFYSNVPYFMCTFQAGLSIILHWLSGDCSWHCLSACLYLFMYVFIYLFIHFCSFFHSSFFIHPRPCPQCSGFSSPKTKFPHTFPSSVPHYITSRSVVLRLALSNILWVFSAFVSLLVPILGSYPSGHLVTVPSIVTSSIQTILIYYNLFFLSNACAHWLCITSHKHNRPFQLQCSRPPCLIWFKPTAVYWPMIRHDIHII